MTKLTLEDAKAKALEHWQKYQTKKERWKKRNVPKWIREINIPYFFPPSNNIIFILTMPQNMKDKVSFTQVELIETEILTNK